MDPTRRGFLGLLPALVAGTTTYFDVGASWQRHGELWGWYKESTIETWPTRVSVEYGIDIQFSAEDLRLPAEDYIDRWFASNAKTIGYPIEINGRWV